MIHATRVVGVLCLFYLLLAIPPILGEEGATGSGAATAEAPTPAVEEWAVKVLASGFRMTSDTSSPGWKSSVFEHASGKIEIAVQLRQGGAIDPALLRTEKWGAVSAAEPPKLTERLWEQDGSAFLDYLIENPKTGSMTKVLHAFSIQDVAAVEIRVTRKNFRPSDQASLEKLVRMVKIVPPRTKKADRG
jgi:hypothetical protein